MLRQVAAVLVGALVVGHVGNCWASPEKAIGKWFRKSEDGAYYIVKDIKQEQETLSAYDLNGELMYEHTVDYEIKPLGDVWVFEFWNRQVALDKFAAKQDDAAAEASDAEPATERERYLFKIQDDAWFEVFNMWTQAVPEPQLTVYKRLADDAKLPWVADKESAFHSVRPKAVLNYFAGQWQLTGKSGDMKYTGRMDGEWTLDHNAVISRCEFFGTGGGGSLVGMFMWDGAAKRIIDKNFTSWGHIRDGAYTIVPDGEFFKLVGVIVATEGDKKTAADVEIKVVDQNHFTWRVIPHDKSKPEMVEENSRVVAP